MNKKELDHALATIKKRTSRAIVHQFLQDRDVPYSANSWKDLFDSRIKPALDNGKLTDLDIGLLLRDAEDFGRKHVFLYESINTDSSSASLIDSRIVKRKLAKAGLSDLVSTAKIVALPAKTEIVDIHFDSNYLSIKLVEPRIVVVEERDVVSEGVTMVRKIKKRVRAVDVVTVFTNGRLEFRIDTCEGTVNYSAVVDEIWALVNNFVPRKRFRETELVHIRRKITVNPTAAIKKLVRVRLTKGVDGGNVAYKLNALRPSGDILDSEARIQGINSIAGGRKSRPGITSVGFMEQPDGLLSRELGVTFQDNVNEFIILRNCTRQEHEYIRSQIEKYT